MSAIANLDPRRDIGLIRERIEIQLEQGIDPADSMADLALRNPIALADLVVGPKAIGDVRWLRAALQHISDLEQSLAPNGLYRRLIELSPELSAEVLEVAVRRHPTASWVVELSRKIEGQSAGLTHLIACAAHPSFAQNCWAHAAAGHLPGLIEVAKRTGRAEPAAALTSSGHLDAAAIAMIAALERKPNAPVVAMITAAWGPQPLSILHRTLPHLRSRKVALSLFQQSTGYPAFARLLDTVIRAMVHHS
jgi:hypothetical protein